MIERGNDFRIGITKFARKRKGYIVSNVTCINGERKNHKEKRQKMVHMTMEENMKISSNVTLC